MNISQIRNSTLEELLDIDLTTLNADALSEVQETLRKKVLHRVRSLEGSVELLEQKMHATCGLINSILTCAQEAPDNKALMEKVNGTVISWSKKHPRVFSWKDYPYYHSIAPECNFDNLSTIKLPIH